MTTIECQNTDFKLLGPNNTNIMMSPYVREMVQLLVLVRRCGRRHRDLDAFAYVLQMADRVLCGVDFRCAEYVSKRSRPMSLTQNVVIFGARRRIVVRGHADLRYHAVAAGRRIVL